MGSEVIVLVALMADRLHVQPMLAGIALVVVILLGWLAARHALLRGSPRQFSGPDSAVDGRSCAPFWCFVPPLINALSGFWMSLAVPFLDCLHVRRVFPAAGFLILALGGLVRRIYFVALVVNALLCLGDGFRMLGSVPRCVLKNFYSVPLVVLGYVALPRFWISVWHFPPLYRMEYDPS